MDIKNIDPELLAYIKMKNAERTQMSLGGNIAAGLVGATQGIAGSLLPGPLGNAAVAGIDSIYGAIDKNRSAEEKSWQGFGKTAGAAGTAIATGGATLATGADDMATGIAQGTSNISSLDNDLKNTISTTATVASPFLGMMGDGGHLNFKSTADYNKWLGYIHANKLAENTPGNQSISIGGSSHRVKHANGGMLTEYNAGGSHEQNPMGGIAVGNSASVEQGETKANLTDGEFIFSDRIKRKGSNKSFAELSKAIKKRFKDRDNDAMASKAMQQQLEGLAQEQEALKAAKMAKMQTSMDALNATGEGAMMAMGGKLKQYKWGDWLRKNKKTTGPANSEDFTMPQEDYLTTNPSNTQLLGLDPEFTQDTYTQSSPNKLSNIDITNKSVSNQPNNVVVPAIASIAKPDFTNAEQSVAKDITDTDNITDTTNASTDTTNPNTPNWLDVAGTAVNTMGDFYNLAQGIRGPKPINLERVNPELINLAREREIARRNAASAIMTNKENARNIAPSSGALLAANAAGTTAIHQNLGNVLSQSAQNEALQNTNIKNNANVANVELANKEKLLNLEAKAKAQESIQAGLTGIGAKTAVGIKDYKQDKIQDKQNARTLNILSTMFKDFKANADGTYTFKNSKGISKTITKEQADLLAKEEEIKKTKEELEKD